MVDTVRIKDVLQDSSNVIDVSASGNVSAGGNISSSKDVSGQKCGVYAVLNASADTTITTAGEYYPIQGVFTNDPIEDFEFVSGKIKYLCQSGKRYMEIDWHCSVSADVSNTTIDIGVKYGDASAGTEVVKTDEVMGGICRVADSRYPFSGTIVIEMDENDTIQLVVTADGSGDVLTFHKFNTTISEFFD